MESSIRFLETVDDSPTGFCNSTQNISLVDLSVIVNHNGIELLNVADFDAIGTVNTTIYNKDGVEIDITFTASPSVPSNNGMLIEARVSKTGAANAVQDTGTFIDLEIIVSKTNYYTYTNTIRFYDYDYGYTIEPGPTFTEIYPFDIVLSSDNVSFDGQVYAGYNAFRKPFSNEIRIYKNNSAPHTNIEYLDGDGNSLGVSPNITICQGTNEDITITQNITSPTDSCTIDKVVGEINWLPIISHAFDCTDICNDECISTISTGQLTINFDYTDKGILIRNYEEVPMEYNQGFSYELYDYAGSLISSDSIIKAHTALVNTHVFSDIQLSSIGDNILKVYNKVIGKFARVITSGTLDAGYYMIVNDSDGNVDFDNCHAGSGLNSMDDVFQVTSGTPITPNSYGVYGAVVPCLVTGSPELNTYYRLIRKGTSANFANIAYDTKIGVDLFSDGTEPTNWGSDSPALGQGDYSGSVITEVQAAVTCWKSEIITACNPYEVSKLACNIYKVDNRSNNDITLNIYSLNADKTFTLVTTEIITPFDSNSITHTVDNIYQYEIIHVNGTNIHIVANYCNLQECMLRYVLGLLPLPAGCDNTPIDCEEKSHYDFNALMITSHTYFSLLNSEYNFNYIYEALQPNDIDRLYDIKTLMEKMINYCEICTNNCD